MFWCFDISKNEFSQRSKKMLIHQSRCCTKSLVPNYNSCLFVFFFFTFHFPQTKKKSRRASWVSSFSFSFPFYPVSFSVSFSFISFQFNFFVFLFCWTPPSLNTKPISRLNIVKVIADIRTEFLIWWLTFFWEYRDDSRNRTKSRLGEGVSGRTKVLSDKEFLLKNRALQDAKPKKKGEGRKKILLAL